MKTGNTDETLWGFVTGQCRKLRRLIQAGIIFPLISMARITRHFYQMSTVASTEVMLASWLFSFFGI
jgi:hypothetical protein